MDNQPAAAPNVGPKTPTEQAFWNLLRTVGVTLGAALVVVLPMLSEQLSTCNAASHGAATYGGCYVDWGLLMRSFYIALISGVVNAITQYGIAAHNVTTTGNSLGVTAPLTITAPPKGTP